jgi:alpha-tubulin suppressor-like RCC1 family protein/V8-like Glu-specific endopeptidase
MLKKIGACVVAVTALSALPVQDAKAVINADRVVSKKGEAPWAVRVRSVPVSQAYGEQPAAICTGVLISQYWVLTAAHCLDGIDNVNYIAAVSAPYSKSPEKYIGYATYHGNYNSTSLRHDVGLIRIFKPIKGATPRKLPPSNDRSLVKSTMRVYGWGNDETGSYGVLKTVRQSLNTESGYYYPNFKPDTMIAARWNSDGKWSGTCNGDSGGPLLASSKSNKYVVGVVSFGIPGCDARFASIYTRVSSYLSWIKATQKDVDKIANKPGAPGDLEAVVSGNTVHLKWSPPYISGKYKVTKYKVEYTVDGASAKNFITGSTQASLIDLEYNRYYEFRVFAWNKSGWSFNPSDAVAVVPGRIKAASPQGLSLKLAGTSIEASWQAPSYTGDSVVLEYEVSVGSDTFRTANTSIIIPDRRSGVTHTVIVKAVTSAGLGAPAYSSIFINIIPPPTAPTSLEVSLIGTSARLSWATPANTYGLDVMRYHIIKSVGADIKTYTTTDSFIDVTNMSPGSRVVFDVFAETSSGLGSKSSKTVFVPHLPNAPTIVSLAANHDSMVVDWSFVDKLDALKADSFEIEYYSTSRASQSFLVSPELRSATITGLQRGAEYSVKVHTVTKWSKTQSVLKTATTLVVPLANITSHNAVRANDSVLISWETASEDAAIEHVVQISDSEKNINSGEVKLVSGTQSSLLIVENRRMYYRIRSQNKAGWGTWSSSGFFPARLSITYGKTFFEKTENGTTVVPAVAGGAGEKKYSIEGALPHGMSFNSVNGSITAPSEWTYDTTHIDSGKEHSCAVTGSGRVACWGDNTYGQLGLGDFLQRTTPTIVASLRDVVSVSAAATHSCAVTSNNEVYCWGSNSDGQLGVGSNTSSSLPVKVGGSYHSITTGAKHSCAIDTAGRSHCWGLNTSGQLGDGTITTRKSPVLVSSLSGVTNITAGHYHTCAVAAGALLYCWGDNSSRQLGIGDGTKKTSPVKVGTLSNVMFVSAGEQSTCANTGAGLYCWGSNQYGQVGIGTGYNIYSYPQKVSISTVENVSVADRHVCTTQSGGALHCWGYDWSSSLVQDTPTPYFSDTVSKVSTGSNFSCTVDSSGVVRCWGRNTVGQLGRGDALSSSTQVLSKIPAKGFPADIKVTVTDDSGYHTVDVVLTNY